MKILAKMAIATVVSSILVTVGAAEDNLCGDIARQCLAFWSKEAPDGAFFVEKDYGPRLDIEIDDGQGGALCGTVHVMRIQPYYCECSRPHSPPSSLYCESEGASLSMAYLDSGSRFSIARGRFDLLGSGQFRDLRNSIKNILGIVGTSARPTTYGGIKFPAGAASFVDDVIKYDPDFRSGTAPDETQQDARQVLGVPDQGEMSLGIGGRIRLRFLDNSLAGSNDDRPDLYVFEVGGSEATIVDISKNGWQWYRVGTVSGFASGIDIDQFGFDSSDRFSYVRITDDGDSAGDHHFTAGADLIAVGARSAAGPVEEQPAFNYLIQVHVGGRSELIIQANKMQWHHLKGPAPGLERQFWSPGKDANSPTIVDSNQGPSISWVPTGWPFNLGNGTHPESYSSVFNGLTPVLPNDGRCWRLEKLWGDGRVKIVQQPNASNDYSLVIRFDDLITGIHGGLDTMAGSGFYAVKLSRTFKSC